MSFRLTLTFDNGPDMEATPPVLDALRERGLKATFFFVGVRLHSRRRRDIALRALAEGHAIGNHTYSHAVPLGENFAPDLADAEIRRAEEMIATLGETRLLFRPLGDGNLDKRLLRRAVVDYLVARRYSCVLWNAIPRDWADPDGWAERALEQCRGQPWSLMVLHDMPTGAMRHLGRFLDEAADAGAEFREDFPPSCVPIVDGRRALPLAPYASDIALPD